MNKNMFMVGTAAFALGVGSAYAVDLPVDLTGAGYDTVTVTVGEAILVGDKTVNGTVSVKPQVTPASTVVNPTAAPDLIKTDDLGLTVVQYFKIGDVTVEGTTTTDGGVTLETNGDGTFEGSTVTTSTQSYEQIQKITLTWNPTGGLLGTGAWEETANELVGGTIDGTNVTEIGALVPTDTDGDLVDDADLLAPADLATITPVVNTTPTAGGVVTAEELQINGAANVDGTLSLGDTGSGAVADAAAAINGNAADIAAEEAARIADVDAEEAARIADVDAEEARAIAAEGVLQDNIDQEVTDRIADVDAEEARAIAAEGV
ncbi:MAG: hypothetical protein RRC34_11505, partial [Lentisphaeria bacterium]|nr:hypothetical protein [Lentisphaeria bacterium]